MELDEGLCGGELITRIFLALIVLFVDVLVLQPSEYVATNVR